jgi:AcrR family transcriptional regulator
MTPLPAQPTKDGGRGRPLRSDAARNRERLLETAAELFADQGLQASVDDVARRAGVGMGTLYRHFPTKEALISELLQELLRGVLEDADRAVCQPDGKGLEAFLYAIGERQSSNVGCLSRLWTDPQHARTVPAVRAAMETLLADAQRHTRVRADLTLSDVFAIVWSLRGVIEMTSRVAPNAWRRHLDIILVGLRPAAEPLAHEPLPKPIVDRVVTAVTEPHERDARTD